MAKSGRDNTPKGPRAAAAEGRRTFVTFVLLLLAFGLMLDGFAGELGLRANRRAQLDVEEAERSLEELKRVNAGLREKILRLTSDPAAIEDAARRDLGLIKPGEKVFIIRDLAPEKK